MRAASGLTALVQVLKFVGLSFTVKRYARRPINEVIHELTLAHRP
jgi:hypothetical protein